MSNGIEIANVGNLGADIELRYSNAGNAWASFSIAVREFQNIRGERQENTTWLRCKIFGEAAENAAESLKKGARVIFMGKLRQEDWTTNEGEKRSTMTLFIDEIGPSTRFAQAKVTKTSRPEGGSYGGRSNGGNGGGGNGGNDFGSRPSSTDADPWSGGAGGAGGYRDDSDPFGADNPFG